MKLSYLYAIVFLACIPGYTKGTSKPSFKKIPNTSAITKSFKENKLFAVSKTWDAKKYCNDETIDNPDQLEAYTLEGSKYELAILCTGTLDGQENVVSVFSKTAPPKVKSLKPPSSSHRITEKALGDAIKELTKR